MKKGDFGDYSNYRPILFINVGYKLYAHILLGRLKDAGAKSKIWVTQFSFRSKCGTSEALLMVRRIIEQADERENKSLILLALDWAKAFDSLSPTSLLNCLARFGVPHHFRADNLIFFCKHFTSTISPVFTNILQYSMDEENSSGALASFESNCAL